MNVDPEQRAAVADAAVGSVPQPRRGIFMLAGAGAGLASAYWALLTVLIGLGSGSPVQLLLPMVLIGLYAVRAVQIFRGDPMAARRILWLHGVGGVAAIAQMASGASIIVVLQGIKLCIHVFGGITAYLAQRET